MKGDRIYPLDPATLQPTGDIIEPCPATIGGPFLVTDATWLGCGKLAGHDGEHEFGVRWSDPTRAPTSRAKREGGV